jgi:ABC-type cobalt transport system substrate-binding protein
MKPALKYGLTGAVLTLTVFLIQFFLQPEGLIMRVLQVSLFLAPIALVYIAVRKQRELQGGTIEFLQALRTGCSTALVISVAFSICGYIAINNINPQNEIISMKKNGLNNQQIIEVLTRMQSQTTVVFQSISSGIPSLLIGCMGAIGATVIMTKRK